MQYRSRGDKAKEIDSLNIRCQVILLSSSFSIGGVDSIFEQQLDLIASQLVLWNLGERQFIYET